MAKFPLSRFALAAALAVSSAPPAPAQIEIELVDVTQGRQGLEPGKVAPAPKWGRWLAGEPVLHGKGEVAVCAFFTTARTPALSGDADYLADLQRRFADRGLAIVAVVGEDVTEAPAVVAPCRVVVDPGAETTQAWFGDPGEDNVVVLDGDGQVTFRGRLGRGVLDAIERTLDGKPRCGDEQRFRRLLQGVESNFDSMVGTAAKRQLDPILQHSPRDGHVLALRYLTAATKLLDEEDAAAWRMSAVDRLANEPRPLAVFVDLVLRGQTRSPELAGHLAAAMVPATAAAPNDPVVQLAYLRALVLAGKGRQVGRQAMQTRKLVQGSAAHCVTFCEILTRDAMPQVHRDLCEQAIARAEELGASRRQLAALKYVVAKFCAEDPEAAAAVMKAYLGGGRAQNNDTWYFMTRLGSMGRHDRFAEALADDMLESREQMDSAELDTAALAMFLAGRVDEAIELQQAALAAGARGNAEYMERLARYEAAAAGRKGETGR